MTGAIRPRSSLVALAEVATVLAVVLAVLIMIDVEFLCQTVSVGSEGCERHHKEEHTAVRVEGTSKEHTFEETRSLLGIRKQS